MIPTFRPWTHTSDDSYIYQLSLVVATATVSFIYLFFLSSSTVVRRPKRGCSSEHNLVLVGLGTGTVCNLLAVIIY